MAVYAYICPSGHSFECSASIHEGPPQGPRCAICKQEGRRDYRAGLPDIHIPMHMSSRNTSNKSDFLPSEKDFESPTDPSGEKGMKEWKDTHKLVGSTWV